MKTRNKFGQFIKGGISPRKGIFKSRITNKCIVCGKFYHTYHKVNYTCSIKCRNKSEKHKYNAIKQLKYARKIKHKMVIGKETKDRFGYILVYLPDHQNTNKRGYIQKHRLIMEKHIGRFLTKQEVVHHIDRNKNNNSLKNLMFFPNHSAHMKFHWLNLP